MYDSDLCAGQHSDSRGFGERPFVDITANYSDMLANAGRLRQRLPALPERPKVVIEGQAATPSSAPKKGRSRLCINPNPEGVVPGQKPKRASFAKIPKTLVLAVIKDLAAGLTPSRVAKKHGLGFSTVKRIKSKGTAAAQECWHEYYSQTKAAS